MADLGGIGQQVTGELIGVAKKAVEETVKAGSSIAKGTAETVVGSGVAGAQPTASQPGGQMGEEVVGGNDSLAQMKARNKAKDKQALDRLTGELTAYRQKKKQEEEQKEAAIEEQKKMQDIEKKKSDKQKRDEDLIRSTQRQYGGTGEAAKKQF